MKNKRIILCGKSASGKTFLKDKFKEKGYKVDVSYTSRNKRPGEIEGIDYYFLPKKDFEIAINHVLFYEYIQFNGNYYGTGIKEWVHSDVFIMEPSAINKLSKKDRKHSFIIYMDPSFLVRLFRMLKRKISILSIFKRLHIDYKLFKDFKNFDIKLKN